MRDANPYAWFKEPFWVQLTSYDGSKYYAWTEMLPTPGGNFLPLDGGRFGGPTQNPAYDPNGKSLSVTSPTNYFQLKRSHFDPNGLDWVYAVVSGGGAGSSSGGTGITVETDNSSVVVSSVTTLQLQHQDFTLSSPAGGEALVGARFSGAQAVRTTNQSITNATPTVLTFTTTNYDTDNYFTSGIPVTGTYLIVAYAQWASSTTGTQRQMFTAALGTALIAYSDWRQPAVSGGIGFATGNFLVIMDKFSATTSVTGILQVAQDSGGNLNITSAVYTITRLPGL